MNLEQALAKLDALERKQKAYSHANNLLYYDGVTAAPPGTAENRGETMAILSEVEYTLATSEETQQLLDWLFENRDALDQKTRRIVELKRKALADMRCIPMEEYIEFERLRNESEAIWHTAKSRNDYAMFEPYLAKIIDTLRRFAGYCAPDKDPYDYWLDNFEGGLDTTRCDGFFGALRASLVPLIQKVCDAAPVDESFLNGDFPIWRQRVLSDELMAFLQLDRDHCTIAETEHPFTIGFTQYDVRITTHYHAENFASSMYSVIHEGGHALYDMHPRDEYAYTALGEGVSMGLHESQSRFYENIIGRSRAFVSHFAPKLRELFPSLEGCTDDALYRAFNASRPSLIRVDADELTYCLHIMVRYELEKQLFAGTLSTKELPAAWNRLYKEYLGVDVPSDREGVLQDSHWAGGMFGYFPSYALGSAYGAQMLAKMRETVDVDAAVAAGDLAPINAWLNERVWQHGCLYPPNELLDRVLEKPFDPQYYVDYLTEKFTEVYKL